MNSLTYPRSGSEDVRVKVLREGEEVLIVGEGINKPASTWTLRLTLEETKDLEEALSQVILDIENGVPSS